MATVFYSGIPRPTILSRTHISANRELTITLIDPYNVSLSDAVTGAPFTDAVTLGSNQCSLHKIIDLDTPYQHPEGIRQVQITSQVVTNVAGTDAVSISAPDHRVTYLYPLANPRSLSYEKSLGEGLISEQFIDGPYLDSTGTDIPLYVSGTTGTITVIYHQWSAVTRYNFGTAASTICRTRRPILSITSR
jgi:hypothetical protein